MSWRGTNDSFLPTGTPEAETTPRAFGLRQQSRVRWGPVAVESAATVERESVVSSVNGQIKFSRAGDPLWAVGFRFVSPVAAVGPRPEESFPRRRMKGLLTKGVGFQLLNATTLRRAATVVGQRSNVENFGYFNAGAMNGADCG